MTQNKQEGVVICADADFPLRNKEAINYMMGSNKLFIFNPPYSLQPFPPHSLDFL